MKKAIILIIIIFLFIVSVIFVWKNKQTKVIRSETIAYELNGKQYRFLIADTSEKWEKGLMYVRKPTSIEGMIFIFPDKQIRNFWNKNTFVDLDLYWIDDKRITGQSFLPSIEKSKNIVIVSSPEPVNKIIEVIKK